MSLRGRKLGLLLSTSPQLPGFRQGLRLAGAALDQGMSVYVYCIDDAVHGLGDSELQALRARGLVLYACAYGAQRRGIARDDRAVFAGLTVVSDLIAGTDRFLSFN